MRTRVRVDGATGTLALDVFGADGRRVASVSLREDQARELARELTDAADAPLVQIGLFG